MPVPHVARRSRLSSGGKVTLRQRQAMAESHEFVKHAHKIQTQLIGLDEGTGKLPVNLITVHSQDHLMNAMVIQDLATDMIELYRRLPLAQ
jgi:PTS system cellobiose-specific IIA component